VAVEVDFVVDLVADLAVDFAVDLAIALAGRGGGTVTTLGRAAGRSGVGRTTGERDGWRAPESTVGGSALAAGGISTGRNVSGGMLDDEPASSAFARP